MRRFGGSCEGAHRLSVGAAGGRAALCWRVRALPRRVSPTAPSVHSHPLPTACSEAEAALRGEEGRGALTAVLRELVARRCQMVCQLGAIFRLGPTAGALAVWGATKRLCVCFSKRLVQRG